MNIIGTGLSGLVGSRVNDLLKNKYTFERLSESADAIELNILNFGKVTQILRASNAAWVFHFAAYTNVQEAEKQKDMGETSDAWQVNVAATQTIIDVCLQSGKKLLYVDTDYAFEGKNRTYTEEDVPHPLGWYAKTKSEGAKRVISMGSNGLVIRISNPYRANPVGKMDFVHKMRERLMSGSEITAPDDQLFVPTFIDDIALAIDTLVTKNASGVYHVVGGQALSPYDTALLIAKEYGYNADLVKKTSFEQYFSGKAPIPQFAVLSNAKISSLGVPMRAFTEGLMTLKQQELSGL